MSKCLTSEQLLRYIVGECTDRELEKIKAHLAQCQTCRNRIDNGAADDSTRPDAQDDRTTRGVEQPGQSPTESMPGVSVFQTRGDEVAAFLETMTDGYKILGVLPRGGQAVVYKAIQKATKRTVAVKVLLQGEHASKRARYRFEQEIELVAGLKHPNIVTIFDSGIAEEQYYYAMEFIKGKPLDEYVEESELSLRPTMQLFSKISSAIAYAHQHGIIHRDLKPGNILVDEQGEPHVLDFGLAKLADGFEQSYERTVMTTMAGQVLGTLAYMSPEQATAQPEAIDVRTDVYSMGVILYRVLTGKFPYPISGPMFEILQNIKQFEPIRPVRVVPGFNSEVEAIVLRALAKEPQRRYQSAIALHYDIQCWLTGMPIVARSDSSLYVLRKLIVRNRYASAVAALLLIIILSFSFASFYLYRDAKHAYELADQRTEDLDARNAEFQEFTQQLTFNLGLAVWYGQPDMEILIADVLGRREMGNQKLGKAFRFLLDERALQEKEAEFIEELGAEYLWFSLYIVGEHYIRDGDSEKALDAFTRSYEAIPVLDDNQTQPEPWLIERIEGRLAELRKQHVNADLKRTNGGS